MIYKSSKNFSIQEILEYLDTCPIKILNSLSDPKSQVSSMSDVHDNAVLDFMKLWLKK